MLDESQQPTSRRRAGIATTVIAALVIGGFGYWFWASHAVPATHTIALDSVRSTLHLEVFVLNLAGENQRAYLRVGVDLGLNHEIKNATELVPVAEVRDTILNVLGDAKVDDMMTSAGKKKLKQKILQALQLRIPRLGAIEVYFTEFLIQR